MGVTVRMMAHMEKYLNKSSFILKAEQKANMKQKQINIKIKTKQTDRIICIQNRSKSFSLLSFTNMYLVKKFMIISGKLGIRKEKVKQKMSII